MKLILFGKMAIISIAITLLFFGVTDLSIIEALKLQALGIFVALILTIIIPEIRGVKKGDPVTIITNSIFGKLGYAAEIGRKHEEIKIMLANGSEISGIIEDYGGLITHPRIRVLYEEKLIE